MGYRIDNYTREELGKIAIPGRAVSTLFWVLPLGRWRPGELEDWWRHFTQEPGDCNALGLLLVRDHGGTSSAGTNPGTNLAQSLAKAEGGDLLDLIPEARHHWRGEPKAKKSLLVLSGAFPQPGWGVLIPMKGGLDQPRRAEELIRRTIEELNAAPQLKSIRSAADAYREREDAGRHFPKPPIKPAEIHDLREALDCLHAFLSAIDNENPRILQSAMDGARNAIGRHPVDEPPDDAFWTDISGRIRLLRDLKAAMAQHDADLPGLWERFNHVAEDQRSGHMKTLHPQQAAWLKKIRFLKESWPELDIGHLGAFLATTFRTDLQTRIEPVLSAARESLEALLKEAAGDHKVRMERYRTAEAGCIERLRAAEAALRFALDGASIAQWELGPAFLMALEQQCSEAGIQARSVAWDPARMIGWKLHCSERGLQPKHLVMAANSVLESEITDTEISALGNDFSGSLFADYVYYVAISAKRLTPWLATRNLLIELLSVAQLDQLVSAPTHGDLLPQGNKQELAEQLLRKWGWEQPQDDATRPLAACLDYSNGTAATLLTSPNETRISFEGFLKDLCRIIIATLGWHEREMKQQLAVHCRDYDWKTRGGWAEESSKLTAGGALVLLRDLVPLAFPGSIKADKAGDLWRTCGHLLNELNRGSHHPPPPPPTPEQLRDYALSIDTIRQEVNGIVGEMPWHLKPAQAFGTEPMIVTGHAWSHSHPEERLIRVIVSSSRREDQNLLVWNRSLTNPVMTDAVLI